MSRRITQTLGIRRRIEGEEDIYGNPKVTYGEPEDWPVYAVAPRVQAGTAEPAEDNRDAIYTGLTVYAPLNGPRPGPHDLAVHAGHDDWEVIGEVGVWDTNPHAPNTRHVGIVVNLDRTEG